MNRHAKVNTVGTLLVYFEGGNQILLSYSGALGARSHVYIQVHMGSTVDGTRVYNYILVWLHYSIRIIGRTKRRTKTNSQRKRVIITYRGLA